MQDVYNRIQQLNLDYMEYFHLKLLLLRRSSKVPPPFLVVSFNFIVSSADANEINGTRNLPDDHLLALEMHIRRAYPLQPQRFEQMKILVNNLNSVSSPEVQNIFFKNILGYCSVELILRNLYESITGASSSTRE